MAIPVEYGDLVTWMNKVPTDICDKSNELLVMQRYWAFLTTAQKTAVKDAAKDMIALAKSDLTDIEAEIDLL